MACLKNWPPPPLSKLPEVSTVGSIEAEYAALTGSCGLLDRSERGKLALTGSEAKSFLQGQVSNDTEALSEGHGCYAAFLTPKGKMLGDLRILDAGDALLLDTERVALQELFNMIRRFSIGYRVELHKRTLESGLLALIGPESDAVARGAFGAVPGPSEHQHLVAGEVRLIRTEQGIDLLFDSAASDRVRQAAIAAGAEPVGAPAAEIVRIERGGPRYGIDLDDSVIPQEAGLNERAVSFTKGCYVGQETVARLFYRGKPNRHLRGLRSDEPLAPGTELRYGDKLAGRVTSVAVSPRFGPIALGFVRREVPVGASMKAGEAGSAVVVELPFA
jgi:folate-binding protein YgfZ